MVNRQHYIPSAKVILLLLLHRPVFKGQHSLKSGALVWQLTGAVDVQCTVQLEKIIFMLRRLSTILKPALTTDNLMLIMLHKWLNWCVINDFGTKVFMTWSTVHGHDGLSQHGTRGLVSGGPGPRWYKMGLPFSCLFHVATLGFCIR